jgi:hypothetical protein
MIWQFGPLSTGQFGPLSTGQFDPISTGQFDCRPRVITDFNWREIHQQSHRFIAEQFGFDCIILLR